MQLVKYEAKYLHRFKCCNVKHGEIAIEKKQNEIFQSTFVGCGSVLFG